MIVEKIGHLCDYILFDEAWAGFMKFHPLYAGRFAMGLERLGPDAARHHRDPIDPQAARELLPGLADPRQGPPHQGPAPAHRASPLQRVLHAARLDLAVLSAVRLARRRRADDEGPVRRGAVGRHHPARHRAAQEGAGDPARVRGQGAGPGAALVLRGLRARSRHRDGPRRRGAARDRLGERADRRPRHRRRATGSSRPARAGTASPMWRRATPSPIPTSSPC